MDTKPSMTGTALHWLPRALAVLFATFVSVFALDVFDEDYGFWGTIWALLIHLVPTYLVIGALLVGWRRPMLGGVCFVVLALAYVIPVAIQGHCDWALIIAGPAVLTGLFFIADGLVRRTRHSDRHARPVEPTENSRQ